MPSNHYYNRFVFLCFIAFESTIFKPVFLTRTGGFLTCTVTTCRCYNNLGPPYEEPQCNFCVINNNSTPYSPQIIINMAVVDQSTLY